MNARHQPTHGSWPSPVDADRVAAGSVRLGQPEFDGGDLLWKEARPTEAGRVVIVRCAADGTRTDVLPDGFGVRTLFREYGGADYTIVPGGLVFANWTDQRLYLLPRDGDPPVPLTPATEVGAAPRYADLRLSSDGEMLYCLRELPRDDGDPVEEIVAVPLVGGTPVVVATGRDFFSTPRCSPDGAWLSWCAWSHPNMPWESCELWLARRQPDGTVTDARQVAGGLQESVFQPEWSPDGTLHFVSDRSGWWNLYRLGEAVEPVYERNAEFGVPHWRIGSRTYGFLADGTIACVRYEDGRAWLGLLRDGELHTPDDIDYPEIGPEVTCAGSRIAILASREDTPAAVVLIDGATGARTAVSAQPETPPGAEFVSLHRPLRFTSRDGAQAHALYWPPCNPAIESSGPPPVIMEVHGGPTAAVLPGFSWSRLYWTSRGFGYCAVNYRGSTGYGRTYRAELDGQWGRLDVADCVAAAEHLVSTGLADQERISIRGASAGGFTALLAAMTGDMFACAVSCFGVTDLTLLRAATHKFESRYLDGLIGPWPETEGEYLDRSPIQHTEELARPVLLLQGELDKVVPLEQAERMSESLRANSIPHGYLTFAGEAHGFRRADSLRRCFTAELAFYAEVFGFEAADDLPDLELIGQAEPVGEPR